MYDYNNYSQRVEIESDASRCGLWWILSTVTTFVFVGITAGIFLWLVLS